MKKKDLEELFKYHSPIGNQPERYNIIRGKARDFAEAIIDNTEPSADQSAAIRKVREAMMTANAGIALGVPFVNVEPRTDPRTFLSIKGVAAMCHEANASYCRRIGDFTQTDWEAAPEWQKASAIAGVEFVLANPNAPASANHESWLAEKERDGWKYGAVKNPETKEHPCFVPYEQLPPEQQAKDHLFKGIVEALRPFISVGAERSDVEATASV